MPGRGNGGDRPRPGDELGSPIVDGNSDMPAGGASTDPSRAGRRPAELFGPWSPAVRRRSCVPSGLARVRVVSPDRVMQPDEHVPPSAFPIEVQRAVIPIDPVPVSRSRWRCRCCSIGGSIGRRRAPTRSVKGSGSRSSTWKDASAVTCSRSTPAPPGRQGTWHRPDGHPHVDRRPVPGPGSGLEVLRPGHATLGRGRPRHRRPSRHVRPGLHREVLRGHGLFGHLSCSENFNVVLDRFGIERGGAGRRSTSSTTRSRRRTRSPWTSRRAARATTCCCGRSPTSWWRRRPVPTTSTDERVESDRHPRAGLRRISHLHEGDSSSRDT